jgi:hypothetical protein
MPRKQITKQAFLDLLHAVHNISTECEPGDQTGENCNMAALNAAHVIFALLEHGKPGERDGVETVVRLLAEVNCSANPLAYALQETDRGNDGVRHCDENAGIALPANVPFTKPRPIA